MTIRIVRNARKNNVVADLQEMLGNDGAGLSAPEGGATGPDEVVYFLVDSTTVRDRIRTLASSFNSTPILVTGVDSSFVAHGVPMSTHSGTTWVPALNATKTGVASGTTIEVYYDVTNCDRHGRCVFDRTGGKIMFPPHVLLYHELAHAFHLANNDFDLPNAEPQAETDENGVRRELGLPERDPASHLGGCCGSVTCGDCPSCLIVTAASGSERSSEVEAFMQIRDQVLRSTTLGNRFVDSLLREYHRFSPLVAGDIERWPPLGAAVMALVVAPLLDFLALLEHYLRWAWQRPQAFPDVVLGTLDGSLDELRRTGVRESQIPAVASGLSQLERLGTVPYLWSPPLPGPAEPERLLAYLAQRMRLGAADAHVRWGLVRPLALYWRSLAALAGDPAGRRDLAPRFLGSLEGWLAEAPIPDDVARIERGTLQSDLDELARTTFASPVVRRRFGRRLAKALDSSPAIERALIGAGYMPGGDCECWG